MPPLIIFLVIFIILTFVVGASFLFRGYTNLPAIGTLAPAEELEKVQTDLRLANGERENLRSQANTLAVQLEEMKSKVAWAEGNVKSLEETLSRGSQVQARLEQLEKDLNFLSQKADSQAREAVEVISRLATENEGLQSSIPKVSTDFQDPNVLTDENQKLKIQIEGYLNKVKELEAVVQATQDAVAKSAGIGVSSAQLTEENTGLKRNLFELEEKIKAAQAEAEKLRAEQAQDLLELQNKISQLDEENKILREKPASAVDSATVQSPAVEEELKRVRLQNEERIVYANAALVKLNSDLELLNVQITEKDAKTKKLTEELRDSRQEMAMLLREISELKTAQKLVSVPEPVDTVDLQKRLEELQAANQHLRDKEKILTYKLVLSRAQAMGLEKMCEEFKYQVESR